MSWDCEQNGANAQTDRPFSSAVGLTTFCSIYNYSGSQISQSFLIHQKLIKTIGAFEQQGWSLVWPGEGGGDDTWYIFCLPFGPILSQAETVQNLQWVRTSEI